MGIVIGIIIVIALILLINVRLSFKHRGKTFPECEKGYLEDAERRAKLCSYSFGLDENNKRVKIPASEDVAVLQEQYKEAYKSLLKACEDTKGKHIRGRLSNDDLTALYEAMSNYRTITSDIISIEYGVCRHIPEYASDEECFVISDDKEFIFMLFNAWYRCRKALKKDAKELAFHTHQEPAFGVNTYGLPKRYTDIERYMLEKGWNPEIPDALNKLTGGFIKLLKEPYPVVDKRVTLEGARITGMSGPVPDPRK